MMKLLMVKNTRFSNNAGGIEGGMSNGMPITVKMAMKPIPTLIKSLRSIDIMTKENKNAHKERTDSCAVPAASIIAESMMCIVLADSFRKIWWRFIETAAQAHRSICKY